MNAYKSYSDKNKKDKNQNKVVLLARRGKTDNSMKEYINYKSANYKKLTHFFKKILLCDDLRY